MTQNNMHHTSNSLPLYSDITPKEAWELMQTQSVVLVDVRTDSEWQNIGVVDVSNSKATLVKHSLLLMPDYRMNPDFIADLKQHIPAKNTTLLFMCKVGGRSAKAAIIASETGYTKCYNILHGFEGIDGLHGWKNEGLPWIRA
jgi:rhodanese-related sulfurtransferase